MGKVDYSLNVVVPVDICTTTFACEKSGVSPEKAYYIGDDLKTDIIGCQDTGMRGIWINRNQVPCVDGNIRTVFSLGTLESSNFK